ncbi:hypothetical protein [Actinomadura rubrisoli]|uniref:CBM6 domain-containing protein n=1 Tax=Actinomadura rubrisoli TaxID=2530368 RepID=A0A4R5C8M3_9ACTN|nr:hypothetical protein [Actinomadura rubrisoli]TDD95129.1 hypothetical protein E1298_05655 [Actinomadura rubrisoli]
MNVINATAVTATLAVGLTGVAGARADARDGTAPIKIEGESATRTNIPRAADRRASGGKYLALASAHRPSGQGWYATYTVHAPAAGPYRLEATLSSPVEQAESSPGEQTDEIDVGSHFALAVNGGPFTQVARSQAYWAGAPHAWGDLHRLRLDDVELRRGINKITFRIDEPVAVAGAVLHRFLLDSFTLTRVPIALSSVHIQDPATNLGVYRSGADLRFRLNGRAAAPQTVRYEISDYRSARVASGSVTIPAGTTTAALALPDLRPGHYTTRATLSGTTVVGRFARLPRQRPVHGAGNRFGVNNWVRALVPSSRLDALAGALRQMGAGYVRDGRSWPATEPRRGRYAPTPQDRVTAALHGHGLKTLEVIEGPPEWAMTPASVPLPFDLRAAYGYARHLAGKAPGTRPDVVQMSNEPDVDDTASTGDQQAAYVKAAALGAASRRDRPLIALPGIADEGPYQRLMLRSDVVRYADIWSFHGYPWPPGTPEPEVPSSAGDQRELWRRQGGGTAMWMTESGVFLPVEPGQDPGRARQSEQARYLVRSAVEDLAAGVDKHFWFAAPPLTDDGVTFSVFSRDFQPLPAYSAHAALTALLGRADFVRRLPGLPTGTSGHLFDSGTRTVTVLWAAKPTRVKVPVPGPADLYDIMGAPLGTAERAADGTVRVTASPDPIYLVSRRAGSRPARPDGERRPRRAPTAAEQIVLSQRYSAANAAPGKDDGETEPPLGYRMDTTTRMWLDVYNFGHRPRKITVSGRTPSGWTIRPGAPTTVTVPAQGRVSVPYAITAGAGPRPGVDYELTFTGTLGGHPIPPSTSWIQLKR